MSFQPSRAAVSVAIVEATVDPGAPSWHLTYEVRNATDAPVWLVDDGALVLRRVDAKIELSYAREAMRPGAKVFGYFVPAVAELPARETLRRSVVLRWPCRLSDLWNAEREAAPPPGDYEVTVRIGFATTPRPAPPGLGEDVEQPVLAWQKTVVSEPVTIALPPYPVARDDAPPPQPTR